MIANTILVAGAFVSFVAGVPFAQPAVDKRDIVYETSTEVAFTTVPVTVTHWLEPGETPPSVNVKANAKHYGGGHGHKGKGHGHKGRPSNKPSAVESAQTQAPPAPVVPSSYEAPEPAPAPSSQAPPPPAYTQQAQAQPPAPEVQPEQEAPSQQAPPPPPAYTSQAPPPPPKTTQQAPPPAPAPTQQAPPPTYEAPEPVSPPSYGGGVSGAGAPGSKHTGEVTHYTPGLGSCGITSADGEMVVALAAPLFDQYTPNGNPNKNPLCNQVISITGKDGKTYDAKVVDRCPVCAEDDLDLTLALFNKVTKVGDKVGDGRVGGMKWTFA